MAALQIHHMMTSWYGKLFGITSGLTSQKSSNTKLWLVSFLLARTRFWRNIRVDDMELYMMIYSIFYITSYIDQRHQLLALKLFGFFLFMQGASGFGIVPLLSGNARMTSRVGDWSHLWRNHWHQHFQNKTSNTQTTFTYIFLNGNCCISIRKVYSWVS